MAKPPNPIRMDPTRTGGLRRKFLKDIGKRFRDIRVAVRATVDADDAFGLRPASASLIGNAPRLWAYLTDPQKVNAFQAWLQELVNAGVLSPVNPAGDPWLATYIDSAYRTGAVRAYVEANSADLATAGHGFYQGGRAEFLRAAFDSPETVSKLQLLFTRSYANLKGITAAMDMQTSRVLTAGLAHGESPRTIGRKLAKEVTGITRTRANALARTEIIHAHAEGQLDTYEKLGATELQVLAEWSTAGDDLVCPLCLPLDGVVMTIKEARGILPRHPNCRCMWMPANVGESRKGQKTGKGAVQAALRKSAKKERPRATDPLSESNWLGADAKPTKLKLRKEVK